MKSDADRITDEHFARGREIALALPLDVQNILKRKSSSDPSDRFFYKLHVLLSYGAGDPEMAEEIGAVWYNDGLTFRLLKHRILGIMDAKINALNRNLKASFRQLREERRGWTQWVRDGFNRRGNVITAGPSRYRAPGPDLLADERPVVKLTPKFTHLSDGDLKAAEAHVVEEWKALTESDVVLNSMAAYFLVSKAADRYRMPGQAYANAFRVLQAIIAPENVLTVQFWNFYKFMGQFGPAGSIMLKIRDLLKVAMCGEHPWLYLGWHPDPCFCGSSCAAFDEMDANGLKIHDCQVGVGRVWNLPNVLVREDFLVDDGGRRYGSWAKYFMEHPISGTTSPKPRRPIKFSS
jgi:hypothetical protein